MKNIILIVLLFITANLSVAQSPVEKKNELGVNVNMLLNKFVFTDENVLFPLFIPKDQFTSLTYRRHMSTNVACRIGLGFYNDSRQDTFSAVGFMSDESLDIKYIGFQIGLQRRINISKRVKPYFGVELLYRHQKNSINRSEIITSGFDWEYESDNVSKKNGFGIGLPIGFQIYATERISISTESYLEIIYEETKDTFTEIYTGNNSNKNTDKSKSTFANWNVPLAIFINYSF